MGLKIQIASVFVIALLAITIRLQYSQIQDKISIIEGKEKEIAELLVVNGNWEKKLDLVLEFNERSRKQVLELSQEVAEMKYEKQLAVEKLEIAKKRNNVVLAKPKLIERLSNKATKKLLNDLECATGNLEKCGGEK